jgi:DNA-binding SARP family transcriptional activator/tetratricopeptide (TPR) repeat protein
MRGWPGGVLLPLRGPGVLRSVVRLDVNGMCIVASENEPARNRIPGVGPAEAESADLKFGLLGSLFVCREETILTVPAGKQRALLAALLLNADQVVSADELIEVLWGTSPPVSARASLHNYVKRLRKALGDAGHRRISTHPHGYMISIEPGGLDTDRFEALVNTARAAAQAGSWEAAAGRLRDALSLWRGHPLADVDSTVLAQREAPRLAEMRLQALEARIDADLHLGCHTEVIPELRHLAGTHPLQEHLHGLLMLALYRDGRQAEALAAYQHARSLLVEELGTEPGTELRELHQRILAADSALAVPGPARCPASSAVPVKPREPAAAATANGPRALTPAGPLFGRDSESARLKRFMREVVGGRGGSVLIEGEPGIGKSALVQAALAQAVDAGCQVFWGAGDELGQALPLLPFLDGLRVREPSPDPRRTMIARVLRGELTLGRGADVPATLAEQLLTLVAELCTAAPTVLVVDDLQWADQASVILWVRLSRLARHLPLMLVGMMRPVPQRQDLHALQRSPDLAARLHLGGLPLESVTELVENLAGGKPDEDLMRLADGATGNPLYLTELVDALARSSSLTVSDGGAVELTSDHAPGSLSAAIADRLGFVPSWVREVLRAAALLGVDFAVPDLATVLGRGVADLVPAVDEARAAGVLAESGSGLGFRHPLIRAALYEEIPAPVRAAWHREAGRALAEADASADRVARQLLQAVATAADNAEPMDEWILHWLARTAPLLAGQAPRAAAELLRQAVARSPVGSAGHDSLVCRFAEALYLVGDAAEAEQIAHRALTTTVDPDLLVDLHWTLAQCRTFAGRFPESLATLTEALALPGISGRRRARLLVAIARTHRHLGQIEMADQVARAALAEATDADDDWAIGWALHVLTITAAMHGRVADALPLYERALAVTQAEPALTDLRLLLQINKAITLGELDQYDRAIAAAREAQRLADRVGIMVRRAQAQSCLGQLLFHTGRWDDAIAEVSVLQEVTKEPEVACCDHGIAAIISLHRGDIDVARGHLAAAAPHAEQIGNRVVAPLALARSQALEQAGALTEALGVLTGFADNAEELDEVEGLLADGVRLATTIGDAATARSLAARAVSLADDTQMEIPHRQANALYCSGLPDHDAGRLLRAADRYHDAGRPLLQAKALEAAAGVFVAVGDRGPSRAAVIRAIDVYAWLGATQDVARLQPRSREHGIGRGPEPNSRAPLNA